ncbi:hypothetical protein ACXPWS_18345 [Mycobacterium sp. BMJ-28]
MAVDREDKGRDYGVEVRVHGIGDHERYSALGEPTYKETVDGRVWIGRVPQLPRHKLRLVNWSRANRKITRNTAWYLAFPFTLLNVAGFMEPRDRGWRFVTRSLIAAASLCLTIGLAAWITVIIETAWRSLDGHDDRLTAVVLQASGPTILIVLILYRLVAGRPLVDRGGTLVSLTSIAALGGMIVYLHQRPASRTRGYLHSVLTNGADNAIDPMTPVVVYTTAAIWIIALVLGVAAWINRQKRAHLAGSAILAVLAVVLLHVGGSVIRLFVASAMQIVPFGRGARADSGAELEYILLPKADDFRGGGSLHFGHALRIDLIPLFLVAMIVAFSVFVIFEVVRFKRIPHKTGSQPRDDCTESSDAGQQMSAELRVVSTVNGNTSGSLPGAPPPEARARSQDLEELKGMSAPHYLVNHLSNFLPQLAVLSIVLTAVFWLALAYLIGHMQLSHVESCLIALKVAGAITIILIVMRRPEDWAARLGRFFGSVADIAGFWAPDLHPLAGASYRRALLSGIRQSINDLVLQFPDEPVALVGHSQGSVVCAWFVRGGHWMEKRTEGRTDRRALKQGLHLVDREPSDRIALFTCGSPLHSLYQNFFPRYFDDDFFSTALTMSYRGEQWHNYWRATDPIGTCLPQLGGERNRNCTELAKQDTLGHSEYWKDDRLRSDVTAFFHGVKQDKEAVGQPFAAVEREMRVSND